VPTRLLRTSALWTVVGLFYPPLKLNWGLPAAPALAGAALGPARGAPRRRGAAVRPARPGPVDMVEGGRLKTPPGFQRPSRSLFGPSGREPPANELVIPRDSGWTGPEESAVSAPAPADSSSPGETKAPRNDRASETNVVLGTGTPGGLPKTPGRRQVMAQGHPRFTRPTRGSRSTCRRREFGKRRSGGIAPVRRLVD